jgi:hypothetical protein
VSEVRGVSEEREREETDRLKGRQTDRKREESRKRKPAIMKRAVLSVCR